MKSSVIQISKYFSLCKTRHGDRKSKRGLSDRERRMLTLGGSASPHDSFLSCHSFTFFACQRALVVLAVAVAVLGALGLCLSAPNLHSHCQDSRSWTAWQPLLNLYFQPTIRSFLLLPFVRTFCQLCICANNLASQQ